MSKDERVLCIPAEECGVFEGLNIWRGAGRLVMNNPRKKFIRRSKCETDPSWKQVIPYALIHNVDDNTYLVYERGSSGGEGRLHAKLSVGIGGHVADVDFKPSVALRREIEEEVGIREFNSFAVGVINSNQDDVERVHVGILYVVEVEGENVDSRYFEECIENPRWLSRMELKKIAEEEGRFERWSQIVVESCLDSGII